MAQFIVRVELHGAVYSADYDTLHTAMASAGFSHVISANGSKYYLPTAEYVISSTSPRSQVLASAKSAAAKTGKGFEVLVTEGYCAWDGLVPVR